MGEVKVPVQSAAKRVRNFDEVVLGLDKRNALEHAKIYLQREGANQGEDCPLGTDIFGFIRELAKGDINAAFNIISQKDYFPSISGRLLKEPYEQIQVFDKAGLWVSARQLERFVGDNADIKRVAQRPSTKSGKKVAVVGSGSTGLAAAIGLAKKGHHVVILETLPQPGGVWRYGYPEFRLPRKIVERQIEYVQAHGVDIKCNQFIGSTLRVETLLNNGYDAVYLATGSGIAKSLNISGEHLFGVIYGEDFLIKTNSSVNKNPLVTAGDKVVVIGSGNTAFDCARISLRCGAKVTLVAKGTKDDLAVKPQIVTYAEEEGLAIEAMTNSVQIMANEKGFVGALKCRRFDYADQNQNSQWQLIEVPNSDFEIPADLIIIAVGHKPNHLVVKNSPSIHLKKDGRISTHKDSLATDVKGVFAGGNVVDGPGPFYTTLLSSRQAVEEIDQFLKS